MFSLPTLPGDIADATSSLWRHSSVQVVPAKSISKEQDVLRAVSTTFNLGELTCELFEVSEVRRRAGSPVSKNVTTLVFLVSLSEYKQMLFEDGSAVNKPILVNLRIEGEETTIFEGPVLTRGHNVTTVSGGDHHCDGTNNNANPEPGATCTSALDDAGKVHGFTFDGTFSTEFDDFFITSIAGESQTATQFWGILLNFQFTPVGGCQQEVKPNDDILFAFDAFSKVHFLKLTGPQTAHVGQAVVLTVTDGQNGSAVAGADVNGQTSDANGHVSITFSTPGPNGVKAEKSDSIRSNELFILVV